VGHGPPRTGSCRSSGIRSRGADADANARRADPQAVERRDHSKLWLGIAAALSLLGGRRGRTAALEGVVSIRVTSATVNILAKSIAARPRPDRAEPDPFPARVVEMPRSTSFPSGHAASRLCVRLRGGPSPPGTRRSAPPFSDDPASVIDVPVFPGLTGVRLMP
jgi:hypothetical protein